MDQENNFKTSFMMQSFAEKDFYEKQPIDIFFFPEKKKNNAKIYFIIPQGHL